MNKYRLEPQDTLIMVIDVQVKLMAAMKDKERVYKNINLLLDTGKQLDIPVLVTEQYPKGLGPTVPEVAEHLADYKYMDKTTFSACTDGLFDILQEIGRKTVKNMVDATVEKFGTVDILVNNAGIQRRDPCIEMSEEDWDAVIRVNLKGVFLCSREVGKILVQKGSGKVINIASLLASVAQPNRGPYTASKGAVAQFTKVLALEWAPYNINVNAIAPGYVATELNTKLLEDKQVYDELTSRIPMGRWCEPEELTGAVVFLASNASSYMTGQLVNIDGGYLCL